MELKGKVVLVTGGSSGIGKECALAFAKAGAIVVVGYRADKKAATDIATQCPGAMALQLDVLDDAHIKTAIATVIKKFGRIDILVNNAAVVKWAAFAKKNLKDVELELRTNLEGLIKVTLVALPHVKMILNVGSVLSKHVMPEATVYCASKYGVRGFTQALATEVDIPVYCINPGSTATKMTDYQGVHPSKVAAIIVRTAQGAYKVKSGGDMDVEDHL